MTTNDALADLFREVETIADLLMERRISTPYQQEHQTYQDAMRTEAWHIVEALERLQSCEASKMTGQVPGAWGEA